MKPTKVENIMQPSNLNGDVDMAHGCWSLGFNVRDINRARLCRMRIPNEFCKSVLTSETTSFEATKGELMTTDVRRQTLDASDPSVLCFLGDAAMRHRISAVMSTQHNSMCFGILRVSKGTWRALNTPWPSAGWRRTLPSCCAQCSAVFDAPKNGLQEKPSAVARSAAGARLSKSVLPSEQTGQNVARTTQAHRLHTTLHTSYTLRTVNKHIFRCKVFLFVPVTPTFSPTAGWPYTVNKHIFRFCLCHIQWQYQLYHQQLGGESSK